MPNESVNRNGIYPFIVIPALVTSPTIGLEGRGDSLDEVFAATRGEVE